MIAVSNGEVTLKIVTYLENQVEQKNYHKTQRSLTGEIFTSCYGYDKIVHFVFLLNGAELENLNEFSRSNFFVQGTRNLISQKDCFLNKLEVFRKNQEADIYFVRVQIGQFIKKASG